MPYSVRQLMPDDTETCIGLRREALDQEPFAFLSSPDDDRGLVLSFVREALASQSQATFGAFAPDLVGIVGINRESHLKAAHKAHIWGFYVTPRHRQGGIGRSLMKAALRFARELPGVTQVHLGVGERNEVAIRLYESLGFVAWGTEPAALRVGGESVAEHHMVLDLSAGAV